MNQDQVARRPNFRTSVQFTNAKDMVTSLIKDKIMTGMQNHIQSIMLSHNEERKSKMNDFTDIWRKVRVLESGVIVMKEFQYNLKPGSKIYVSSDNDILLDFSKNKIEIRSIRNDGKTEFIDEVKRYPYLMVPAYFSDDFKKYIIKDFPV